MKKQPTMAGLAVLGCLIAWAGGARAADLSFAWEGTVAFVDTNQAGALHGDVIPGVTSFAGFVVYPDTCDAGCFVEPFGPDETNYVFPGGFGGLWGGGGTSTGVESSVNIVDDQVVDQEAVDFAALLGFSLELGQTLDVWSAASETAGEFTTSFVDWNVEYTYWTSNPFSDTGYVSTPPPNPDVILFSVSQDNGNILLVGGLVNGVPEPEIGSMLGAGIAALAFARRSGARLQDIGR
jgi:hypothetical protein